MPRLSESGQAGAHLSGDKEFKDRLNAARKIVAIIYLTNAGVADMGQLCAEVAFSAACVCPRLASGAAR